MDDLTLTCVQCEQDFVYTAAEQRNMVNRGFDMPRRCMACRKHKTKLVSEPSYNGRRDRKKLLRQKYDGYI